MIRILVAVGCLAALGPAFCACAGSVTILDTNFDHAAGMTGSASIGGFGKRSATRGYGALGFGDSFFRNQSGGRAADRTILRIQDLPQHSSIDLDFLLAIIGSWDGPLAHYGGDSFRIKVDGRLIFSGVFSNGFRANRLPRHGKLIKKARLGFGRYRDSAWDMSDVPALNDIPHTRDSVKIEFFARGINWQGGRDESFAIDNLRVILNDGPPECGFDQGNLPQVDACPPPPPAVPLPASARAGLALLGGVAFMKVRKLRSSHR